MLTIRREQLALFENAATSHFAATLLPQLRLRYPHRLATVSDAAGQTLIDSGVRLAASHGFTQRTTAQLVIELMVLLGHAFADDPLLPGIGVALGDPGTADERDPLARARALHSAALDYLDPVYGVDGTHFNMALQQLLAQPVRLSTGSREQFQHAALARLEQFWPQRFAAVGEQSMQQALRQHIARAVHYGIRNETGVFTYLTFSYVLGSGFDQDPLLPWAAKVLNDEPGEGNRAERLHEAAVPVLQGWLAEPPDAAVRPLRPQQSAIQGYPYENPLEDPAVRAALRRAWTESQPDDPATRHLEGGYITRQQDGSFQAERWPRGGAASIVPLPLDDAGRLYGVPVAGEFRTQPHPSQDEQGRRWLQGWQPDELARLREAGYDGASYLLGRDQVWLFGGSEARPAGSRDEVLGQ